MAPAAQDYYRNGPSFINRYIPFWITSVAQRLFAVLLTVFGIILPIARYAPRMREWWVKRQFEEWYGRLAELEATATAAPENENAEVRAGLADVEKEIRSRRLPATFAAQTFSLLGHIEAVRRKLA
jgi:hypothetical protein